MSNFTPCRMSRRAFLRSTAAAGAAVSFASLRPAPAWAKKPPKAYPYRAWEDVYREQWTWDRVVKGTHSYANCAAGCEWDLFVKDGIVWREEQSAAYPRTNDQVPDFNPRGCQKGACYSQLMYSTQRVKWPLKRVGERGEGKWKRVEWDEALTDIADRILDAAVESGPETIMHDLGSNFDMGPSVAAKQRFFLQMGAYLHDTWGELNDLNQGMIQTLGMAHLGGSSDDWFLSDYLVIWNGNPVYTRIPDAHFLLESRYNGGQLVSIAPDYNASSIHADLWVKPRIGTDTALALAMCHVVIEENLVDLPYVQEQTDLPFLVRKDSGRFLRQADLRRGGKDDVFYVWDQGRDRLQYAPGTQGHRRKSLKLGRLDPALEGTFTVDTPDGPVEVEPLFVRVRAHLRQYTPEAAGEICDVHPDMIRKVARDFAAAERAMILSAWGANKFYHSDLMMRSRLLLTALTGNQGKRGAGVRNIGWYHLEGLSLFGLLPQRGLFGLIKLMRSVEWMGQSIGPAVMFDYLHGGLSQVSGDETLSNMGLPREVNDYVAEAMERGWMPVKPPKDKTPRVLFAAGSNMLRRVRSYPTIKEHLWPKLDLVVTVDFRMSNTGLHSDYVLPCAGYYEKIGLKYPVSYIPYLNFADKAVDPLWDSRGDWEIFWKLSEKVQERARARGIGKVYNSMLEHDVDFANFHVHHTFQGYFGEHDDEKALQFMLQVSSSTKGITVEQLRRDGIARFTSVGTPSDMYHISADMPEGETVVPALNQTDKKMPWPTLTGRQQFLIEHPWYVEVGEELPVHKAPLKAGGDYPLRLTGGHTRWSVHTMWRDNPLMLRLNRGTPYMYMAPEDAAPRGISDNDYVKVFNDLSDFQIHVKVSPQVRPGQVIVYHAWEPYQFANNRNHHAVVPSPIKPLHMAGGYGQLHWAFAHNQPGQSDRDTVVEVQKV